MNARTTIDGPAPTVTVANIVAAREAFKGMADASRRASDVIRGFTDAFSPHVVGLRVTVAPHLLPGDVPDHREDAARIVRHGMADVLRWLGEEVGPKPGEQLHAVVNVKDGTLLVSPELYERLQVEAPPPFAAATEPLRSDVYQPVNTARRRAEFEQVPVKAAWGIRL